MGPAISVLDADIGAAGGPRTGHRSGAEAKRAAQSFAVGHEVCSMLGALPRMPMTTVLRSLCNHHLSDQMQ